MIEDLIMMDESWDRIKQLHGGSRYFQCGLHLHTPAFPADWKGDPNLSLSDWVETVKRLGYEFIIPVDHAHTAADFWEQYQALPEEVKEGIIVIPGSEIETGRGIHVQLIFDPTLTPEAIRTILDNLQVDRGNYVTHHSLDAKFFDLLKKKNVFLLYPHAQREKGVWKGLGSGRNREDLFRSKVALVNLPPACETTKGNLSPPASCKRHKGDQGHHQFLTQLWDRYGCLKISDAHKLETLEEVVKNCPSCIYGSFCHTGVTWLKLAEPTVRGLQQITYDSDHRILYNFPEDPRHIFVEGLEIEGGFFDNQVFRFSPWLNVLMGGRGVGKSLLIELIRFVFDVIPSDSNQHGGFVSKLAEQLGEFDTKGKKKNVEKGSVRAFVRDEKGVLWAAQRNFKCRRDGRKPNYNWILQSSPPIWTKYSDEAGFLSTVTSPLNLIEPYGQTEIPNLIKRVEGIREILLQFFDETEKEEFENRKRLTTRYKQIANQYRIVVMEYVGLYKDYQSYLESWEQYDRVSRSLEKVKIEARGLWDHLEALIQSFEESIPNLEIEFPSTESLKSFGSLPEEFSGAEEVLNFILEDIYAFLDKKMGEWEEFKFELEEGLSYLTSEWKKQVREKLQTFQVKEDIEDLLEQKKKLRGDIGRETGLLKQLIQKGKQWRKRYKELGDLNQDIMIQDGENRELWKRLCKRINRELGTRYSFHARTSDSSPFEKHLQDTMGGRLKMDPILEVCPQILFKHLLELNSSDEISSNSLAEKYEASGSHLTVYERICENLRELPEEDLFPDTDTEIAFHHHLRVRKLRLIGPKYLQLPSVKYPPLPFIGIMKGGRYKDVQKTSLGEKVSTLLNLILQEQGRVLLLDQPDSELDFDSIQDVVRQLREGKRNRQIFVATHNPNIPVLGDADQIHFLEQFADPGTNRDQGIIKASGGFESMIPHILALEGGEKALKTRMSKYLLEE